MTVWLALLGASLKSQLAYRRSFLLEALGRFVVVSLELVAVLVMFLHVEDLAGWSRWEVVYLYGVASLSLGIAELMTDGLRDMPELVRLGTLDGILVRPAPALIQVLGRQCRPLHLGRVVSGALALGWGLWMVGRPLGPVELVMLGINVVSPAVVYGAVFIVGAATCIWTVQASEAFNAFTYGGVQMVQFPVTIYPFWLRSLFLWVVPVGLTSYFPALLVLGRPDTLGLPGFLPWLAPVVAAAFLACGIGFWSLALRRYRSTGS